jgi:hypothetical protein
MRIALTAVLAAGCLALAPPVAADPASTCPPVCNSIPETAWVSPSAIPLDSVYDWPQLAGLSVTSRAPRFRFEELCATPATPADARSYAIAERSVVSNPAGQWQLQAQVVHWRGETWRGGQLAQDVFTAAVSALRACQATNAESSPSLVVDEPDRMAAVISGPVILHQYLVADPVNSTITELALWSDAPPQDPWPMITDTAVLDALAAPLCTAYIGSCP